MGTFIYLTVVVVCLVWSSDISEASAPKADVAAINTFLCLFLYVFLELNDIQLHITLLCLHI